jgi:hypothetical protein
MKRLIWLLPLILVFALSACAKAPKAEMDAAETAVARAEAAPGVVTYAAEDLQRAKRALDAMRSEAAAKHYDKAKSFAAEATSAAAAAISSAQANKDRAKAKAAELIEAVKQALPKTEKLVSSAAKVKKAKFDYAAALSAIEAAKASLAEADAAFAKETYLVAADKAAEAQKGLADLESEIGEAVQGATRKK